MKPLIARSRSRRERLYVWFSRDLVALVILAGVVGLLAGGGAIAFSFLLDGATYLFTGTTEYGVDGPEPDRFAPWLGPWFLLIVPVIGGLIHGPLVAFFAREPRGQGVAEVLIAAEETGGRLPARAMVVKTLATTICIGSGGSLGLVAPVVHIGASFGSVIGQRLRQPDSRLLLLLACGAAGGISAMFNAPIAGVFFAMEVILRDFKARAFGMVVIASVAANVVSRPVFGDLFFLTMPQFRLASPVELLLYVLLGLAAGVVGVAFIRTLYATQDLCDRIWHAPEWLRPAAGGIVLGGILVALPQMYGVGYSVMEAAVGGQYAVWFLLLLMVGKMVASSVTLGIGGSGGLVAPALFIGSMLGSAFGHGANAILPGITEPSGAYGLVGMAAVFAATSRAPITAVFMIFEITGEYRIILPLALTVAIATGVSHLLSRESIDSEALRRRILTLRKGVPPVLLRVKVREAMRPVPAVLAPDLPLGEVARRFAAEDVDALPVVDVDGAFLGTVTAGAIERAVQAESVQEVARDLISETASVSPDDSLEEAATALARGGSQGVPVLPAGGGPVEGWITHRDVLAAYAQAERPPEGVPAGAA